MFCVLGIAAITSYMKYGGFFSYNLKPLGLLVWAVSGSSLLPGLGMPPMTSLLPNEFMASLMLKLTGAGSGAGASFPEGRKGSRAAGGRRACRRMQGALPKVLPVTG